MFQPLLNSVDMASTHQKLTFQGEANNNREHACDRNHRSVLSPYWNHAPEIREGVEVSGFRRLFGVDDISPGLWGGGKQRRGWGGGSNLFWEIQMRRGGSCRWRFTFPSVYLQRPPRPWMIHSWREVEVLTWRQCRVSGVSHVPLKRIPLTTQKKVAWQAMSKQCRNKWGLFICLQKKNYLFRVSVPPLGPRGGALQREMMPHCVIWPLCSTGYKPGGAIF